MTCKTCIHEEACAAWIRHGEILYDDFEYSVENCPYYVSTENTVSVDEIKFHHMLIDKDGIPEVKLQFGERILILRRVDDPLDIMEVVHGHNTYDHNSAFECSICGFSDWDTMTSDCGKYNYCPSCGARMDGGK